MTVNEIADMAGVSPRTVQRAIKDEFPEKAENGKRTALTKAEAIRVAEVLRKPGFVTPRQNDEVPRQNDEVDARLDRMERMMEQLIGVIGATVSRQKTIEAPAFYTVVGYANLKGRKVDGRVAQALGIKAKRLCIDRGEPIHPIPNESFGSINSYPEAVLAEVFA
jgi:AcrR family transcriptional regulator